MNDDKVNEAKARLDEALKETQAQSAEAAKQMGVLFTFGAQKLREAADKAAQAIRDDINKRP